MGHVRTVLKLAIERLVYRANEAVPNDFFKFGAISTATAASECGLR
jgi:hypothetical protein